MSHKPNIVLLEPTPPKDEGVLPVVLDYAPAKPTRKLDLAAGQSPRPGFEDVDLHWPHAAHKVDLMKFPWPWPDNSCAELYCSHFIEHLPAREVEPRDLLDVLLAPLERSEMAAARYLGKDFFFAFFDECYRILAPDAWITVVCPAMPTDRAFQDPTHRRFIVEASFYYLDKVWRVGQRLDHYQVACDFVAQVAWSHDTVMNAMHQEAVNRRLRENYNQRHDWIVKLRAHKPQRIVLRDIQGNAISPPNATRFVRFDDGAPGAPWPHPCHYVFLVAGREEIVPGAWPPAPTP